MVKSFVILPSDRQWLDIVRAMEEKGMPVEVQGDECVITAWHRGWSEGSVTFMEFAEEGDVIGKGWVRPDERDPAMRERQRAEETDALRAEMAEYLPSMTDR